MITSMKAQNSKTQARARQIVLKDLLKKNYDSFLVDAASRADLAKRYGIKEKTFSLCWHFRRNEMYFVQIKGTSRKDVPEDFSGYFFSITQNEEETARKLGNKYIFALANVETKNILYASFQELMDRALLKYYTWSIKI